MNQLQERLSEEVRKHQHLYNRASNDYKDSNMTMNSWKEIGETMGMDWVDAMKEWKKIRDKFVRIKKRTLTQKSGAAAGGSQCNKPTFYVMMSWLEVFIKHREKETNYPEEDLTSLGVLKDDFKLEMVTS